MKHKRRNITPVCIKVQIPLRFKKRRHLKGKHRKLAKRKQKGIDKIFEKYVILLNRKQSVCSRVI